LPNDDGWAHFTNGNVNLIDVLRERVGPDLIPTVPNAGYNFDFFDDEAFKQAGGVEKSSLVLGTNRYKVVILPTVERIPLETMQKLEEFARSGGALIATRRPPTELPEFRGPAADQQRLRNLSRRTFEDPAAPGHLISDETVQLASTLNRLVHPDVSFSPPTSDIGFIHRSAGDIQIYFLANTSNASKNVKATFRQQGLKAEWWDPFTGNVTPASIESVSSSDTTETTVRFDVEPYGSRVLVFSKRTILQPQRRISVAVPDPIDLSRGWQISFGSNNNIKQLDNLHSWTDEEKTRYFSGTATYEKTASVGEDFVRNSVAVKLDLGEARVTEVEAPRPPAPIAMRAALDGPIREAAVIYVNDRRAGSVWCPPYSLDVTGLLRREENKIRIVVANTAINYMAGHALPDYRLLNLRYGERFQVQDLQKVRPIVSSLLGPVRLMAKPN
jgi:hypothetical protein